MKVRNHYFVILITLCVAVVAAHADSTNALIESLVKKRSDVEVLTEKLEHEKRIRREQQRAFLSQKAQLEAELQRESVRHSQLTEAISRKKQKISATKVRDGALMPLFESSATSLKAYLEGSLPFRKNERLSELKSLQDKLAAGLLTPRSAMTRLWSLFEDERQLSKETGLYRDTVTVDGAPLMVDVVRFGTLGMYFKTGTGRYGLVMRTAQGWTTRYIDDETSAQQLEHLFDAFKKQIRVGLFSLPNMLPPAEGQ